MTAEIPDDVLWESEDAPWTRQGTALWEHYIDCWEDRSAEQRLRLQERLNEALRQTGASRDAVGIWSVMGGGGYALQGRSGTGTVFRIFSPEVLEVFIGLEEPTETHRVRAVRPETSQE
jgi:hypothetical protein